MPRHRSWVLLVLLAYVPALLSAPGRMPADSKLYLYLDPGRLLRDAATTFDPHQFAGWVPHQHIAYLWPAGPWFWLFDTLGVPDWVAHRLWIGTLLAAAGLGVRWCARVLGLGAPAALAAALVYQLSPYLLPYVSRTSVMLLPWAGLGWIVGLTVRATRRGDAPSRWARWGDPAALALVVLTVGAVNATALAMVVPAPLLWLVHSVWLGDTRWRAAVGVAARTAVLAVGVSLWWVVMLVIQGRHGGDVLPYSESLADVSFTATSTEVWRSLGYWLFYVRDRFAPTTTAALPYLSSSPTILVSFAVPVLGLIALVAVRWRHRRFAALLLATGLILGVGVHPIDERSPLMRTFTGNGDEGLALALRSSTRAVPLAVLGLALALAAAVQAVGGFDRLNHRWPRWLSLSKPLSAQWVAAGVVGVVALANLPALWRAELVDPALERDPDPPAAWTAAASALDDPATRVLQLPGLEFGAFRWGYTVDQPLATMATSGLVTRDLLPLGAAAAMDLLYALDDRIQDGVLEPASVATLARLLGTSNIWLSNDAAYDRFDVTAPGIVRTWLDAAAGVGMPTAYGSPELNHTEVEMADARYLATPAVTDPAAPVVLYPVESLPQIARAAAGTLVISGSGDGVVDAAAAGLLPEQAALVYSAAIEADDLTATLADGDGLLVTDSNRARARHWRSSQDTTGFTESAGRDGAAPTELTEPAVGDARLPVFADAGTPVDPGTQTTAEQRGPVVARANTYGQPFALLPEHRPFMAVDGDPATAWIAGEHGDPVGAVLDLTLTEPGVVPTTLVTAQYAGESAQREITALSIRAYDATGELLGEPQSLTRQVGETPSPFDQVALDLPAGTARITLTIDAVEGGHPGTAGAVAGVGFATVDLGLGSTTEVVRTPSDALDVVGAGTPVTLSLTRLRVDPADRWRDDPEPTLVREFALPQQRVFTVTPTVRLDARAGDEQLAGLLNWPAYATSRVGGRPDHAGVAAIDGDPSTSWVTGFGDATATLVIGEVTEPVTELTVTQPPGRFTRATALELTAADGQTRTVVLAPDASGVARAVVEPPLPAGQLALTIAGTEPESTIDRRFGDRFELPVAISEVALAGLPALPDYTEATALTECLPIVAIGDATFDVALTTQPDPARPSWLGSAELVALPCGHSADRTIELAAGSHLVTAADAGVPVQLDRLVLAQPFTPAPATPSVTVDGAGRRDRELAVTGCPDGCWVILGEGYNQAWQASVGGTDLGPPTLLDGGFTGWWVGPEQAADGTFTLHARWTAQRPLTIAYTLSAATIAACIALVVLDRRRRTPPPPVVEWARSARIETWSAHRVSIQRRGGFAAGAPLDHRGDGWGEVVRVGVVWMLAGGLLVGPGGAVGGVLGTVGLLVLRDRRVPELTAAATVLTLAGAVLIRERRLAPLPDGGWPHVFEQYHGLGMFAIASVVVAAVCADDTKPEQAAPGSLPSAP
ncbi:MAG TPA: alpha-(1-_3)-arabinofuranosyltransferase family protein [Ilumatobacter sp.]|nr:alpha-(1->3)-arabinofuranosyltransferase family protein [Ilumatobacter sp.]